MFVPIDFKISLFQMFGLLLWIGLRCSPAYMLMGFGLSGEKKRFWLAGIGAVLAALAALDLLLSMGPLLALIPLLFELGLGLLSGARVMKWRGGKHQVFHFTGVCALILGVLGTSLIYALSFITG